MSPVRENIAWYSSCANSFLNLVIGAPNSETDDFNGKLPLDGGLGENLDTGKPKFGIFLIWSYTYDPKV